MFPSWFRQLTRSLFSPLPTVSPGLAPLGVLELEDRVTPATITWTNPLGGQWQNAANWDLNRIPTAGDDVVIPDVGEAGASVLISHNLTGATTTVQSVTSAENLALTGATTLTLSGGTQTISATGSLTINNATLAGATIASGTTLTTGGMSVGLNGVTVSAGSEVVTGLNAVVAVTNGLTVDGRITLGSASNFGQFPGLWFAGTQSVLGSGEIVSPTITGLVLNQSNMTLTLGPDLTVRGGMNVTASFGASNTTLRNEGRLRADGGGTMVVGLSPNTWIGTGQLTSFVNAAPTVTNVPVRRIT